MSSISRVTVSLSYTFVFGKRVAMVIHQNDFKCAKGYTGQKKTNVFLCKRTDIFKNNEQHLYGKPGQRSHVFYLKLIKNDGDFEQKECLLIRFSSFFESDICEIFYKYALNRINK